MKVTLKSGMMGAEEIAHWLKSLLCNHEDLNSDPQRQTWQCACNPRAGQNQMDPGGSQPSGLAEIGSSGFSERSWLPPSQSGDTTGIICSPSSWPCADRCVHVDSSRQAVKDSDRRTDSEEGVGRKYPRKGFWVSPSCWNSEVRVQHPAGLSSRSSAGT